MGAGVGLRAVHHGDAEKLVIFFVLCFFVLFLLYNASFVNSVFARIKYRIAAGLSVGAQIAKERRTEAQTDV